MKMEDRMGRLERATANRGRRDDGDGMTLREAQFRMLKSGAARCKCGEPAVCLIGGGGRAYVAACPLCRKIAHDRTRAAVMSIR